MARQTEGSSASTRQTPGFVGRSVQALSAQEILARSNTPNLLEGRTIHIKLFGAKTKRAST